MRAVDRSLGPRLLRAAKDFPAVVLTGPRRAGKTFLLRRLFPDASYHLLEDPEIATLMNQLFINLQNLGWRPNQIYHALERQGYTARQVNAIRHWPSQYITEALFPVLGETYPPIADLGHFSLWVPDTPPSAAGDDHQAPPIPPAILQMFDNPPADTTAVLSPGPDTQLSLPPTAITEGLPTDLTMIPSTPPFILRHGSDGSLTVTLIP